MSVAKRIKQLLDYKNLNHRELAKEIGITPAAVGKYISGENKPSFIFWEGLANKHPDVNIGYMLVGKGDMMLTSRNETLDFKNEVEMLEFIRNNPNRFKDLKSYNVVMEGVVESNRLDKLEKKVLLLTQQLESFIKEKAGS